MTIKTKLSHRLLSIFLCIALLMSYLPMSMLAMTALAEGTSNGITTVADPETLTRPETIYGDSTVNAGKVTVGKSVSDKDITVNGQKISIDGANNFLVTISQSAQVMGLTSQSEVPVDVVFVLDTSGSMADNNRAGTMVTAANSAIKTLMENDQNRVAVVAFSSKGYGYGTSQGAAANVLSSLAHYDGEAATNHLRWSSSDGNDYIVGRNTVNLNGRNVNAYRHGKNGGTNIQAGIVEGAKILTSVSNTVYTNPETNETITRIPFLIILSDGQPTFSYDDDEWYDPVMTGTNAANEQGPGDGAYEGNGFIAAMTAAYYKGKITEHYYGDKASNDNHCYIYTMGVEINNLTGDEKLLAQITLDPKSQTTGDYADNNANSYWNYGNTSNDNSKNAYYGWKSYWNNYLSNPAVDFGVRVNGDGDGMWVWSADGTPEEYYAMQEPREPQKPREPNYWASQASWDRYYALLAQYEADMQTYNTDKAKYDEWLKWRNDNFTFVAGQHYTFTSESVAASKKYVNGIGYTGGIAYNDSYFSADNVNELQTIFENLVRTIQQKAISVPTKVTTGNYDFDGYVTFTDPIGEYMEVKEMKGVLAGGYFYQGKSFAEKLSKYGTQEADTEFDALVVDVVKSRMNLTSSVVDIDDFIAKMKASKNQAYYNGPDDYDNSIVWWGNAYNSGEEDEQVQVLGFADNDTIEYIESQKTAGTVPAGADYVCRSYFFYGEAGGANPNPDHEYLYFMVRVQRELTAPYKETVVISAPASLLSMEKVLIKESFDQYGNPVYEATVEHQEPARVVYEVGLWDTINAENVSYIVSEDYASEKVNGKGSVNYDAATDTYNFFTNDWDRSQTLDSHHRGLAKATFDAAADNAFYTYQQDTLLVDANGNPVISNPIGTTAYYAREYYEWSSDSGNDGTYAATKKTTLLEVDIPADAALIEKGGKWYIPKGTYTAATLVVNGDDTLKDDPATQTANDGNFTGTSSIVAHPHRTGDATNSHYTVFLGNNGRLSLEADPYEPSKTVSVNLSDTAVGIVDDEGKPVKIGDVLTYTVEVKNVFTEAADITVSDYVPMGTAFVEGSAGYGAGETNHTKDTSIKPDENNVLNWTLKDVPAGAVRYVSFKVIVTETAMSLNVVPGTIDNTATVHLENAPAVITNTTHNPTYGKTVTDVNNQSIDGEHGFKVGDTLVYHIRFHNNATDSNGNFVAADVIVTDKIPEGTTFLAADNGGSYNEGTGVVTWSFDNMAADTSKIVSFRVKINAGAKIAKTGTQPETGEIYLPNSAVIVIDNIFGTTLITNTAENWADVGDMIITKTVAAGGDTSKTFTVNLTDASGMLDGTYVLLRGSDSETVIFSDGKASVTIKNGEVLTVKGLPAGAIISVEEDLTATPGWTPTYNTQSVTILKGAATTVSSVNVINTYKLQPLTVTVKGEKNMKGILPDNTTFGFIAVPDSNNPVAGDPLTGEVTVKNSGKYEFALSPKAFTKPGVYKYTVSEINGGVEGVTYDDTDYVLIITVTDNGDGTMSATATLDGNTFDIENDAVSFSNTYIPDDVPLTVTAQKIFMVYDAQSGTYKKANVSAGQFRFQITEKASGKVVAAGKNAADGSITFETFYLSADMLGDSSSKEFTYVVSEVVSETDKDPNMLYDLDGAEFKATLSLTNNGTLSVSVGGDSDGRVDLTDTVSFTNYGNPDSVEVKPEGTKTTSNAPAGVTFSFAVINTESGNVPSAGVGSANGSITFSPLSFTKTGTYTYWIKESNAGNTTNGITYDASRYLMKVVVTRDSYNRLVADVSYLTSNINGSANVADYTIPVTGTPAFRNEYNAGGYINLTATKKLTGRTLNAGEFAFKLIRQDTKNEIDGIVDANGKITFSTLYYSENDIPAGETSKVIHYVMSEVIPETAKLPGVTYDVSKHDVYIRITDNGNGTITATLVKPDGNGGYTAINGTDTGVTFNNSYNAVNGDEVNFRIKKTLKGRDLRAGEFNFQLLYNGNAVESATNDANGNVNFNYKIAATAKPGTYTFTVKETGGNSAGVTYSTASFDIKIKITDDGKGNIVAQLVDASGAALPETNGIVDLTDEIEFVNTYVPSDATVQLEATKNLSGRPLGDKEFSFVVRKDTVNGAIVATGNNAADGRILFSTFNITAKDMAGAKQKTFTYVVTESNNNVPGVTVDDTVFTVTVSVTDNGAGKLIAVINYPNNAPVVFKNVYKPDGTDLSLSAFKTLIGKNLADKEFTFELKDAVGKVLQTKYNNQNGVVTFDKLFFTAEDMLDQSGNKVMTKEFVYTVSEKAGNVAGMVYDTNIYTVTVTVTDDGMGNLTATATYADAKGTATLIRFENSYTPAAVEVELEGTKAIVDADGNALTDSRYPLNGFEFEVKDTEDNPITTATSDDKGNIKFTGFEFTTAGEYRFLISEKTTNKAGYTTDPTVWCVHITISYNADTGLLYKSGEYVHLAPENHNDIIAQASETLSFVNVYDPSDVSLGLKIKKELDGRKLRDHEFVFHIINKATGLRVAEARNDANGNVSFSLSYNKAGVYEYTVVEYAPTDSTKLGGVDYSDEKYDVTVTVTDDGSGALSAAVGNITFAGSNIVDMTDTVIFHNTYKADSVDVIVEAVKQLEGKALKANSFTFKLVNNDDPTEKYTAVNTADGKVKFEAITFDKVGTYTYTLSEVEGTKKGITYDKQSYTATIVVTDDGNGKLHAITHYTNRDGGTEAVPLFKNSYKAAPAEYIPEVKKIYEGGNMLTFDFVLSGDGFAPQTKQNNADGEVTFDKLVFTNSGSYTFTIEEKADPSIDDIKWDTNVYTMVIEVTDNMQGQLEVTAVDISSDNGRKDFIFRNVHEDLITDKDVYLNNDLSISIDDKSVEKGDVLTYTISYKNYTGKIADITITDTIPEYTTYVDGSADKGGVYSNGVLTWNLIGIEPEQTVTVSFSVKVTGTENAVENEATVIEGNNTYETNSVTNTIGEDTVIKDVFHENEPTVSIDGQKVKKNDILLYKVTYTNSDDFAADVTIIDKISEYVTYVDGSADNGGVYNDGKLTWTLSLSAGESKTVTFKVKVDDTNVTVENKATALEGNNEIATNVVTNPVPEDKVVKDVFHESKPTVSIDGGSVRKDDVLIYAITYTNSFEAPADVTITDTISEYVTYVSGSADNGGVYNDGKLSWTLSLAAGESKTVTFKVKVDYTNVTVENKATALEGTNKIDTNVVTSTVPAPEPEPTPDPKPTPDPAPTPDTEIPETGDSTNLHLWFALLFVSGGGIIGTTVFKKRSKKTEEN